MTAFSNANLLMVAQESIHQRPLSLGLVEACAQFGSYLHMQCCQIIVFLHKINFTLHMFQIHAHYMHTVSTVDLAHSPNMPSSRHTYVRMYVPDIRTNNVQDIRTYLVEIVGWVAWC